MLPLLKPIFRFRKYLLAGKLLKYCTSSYVAVTEMDPGGPETFIRAKGRFYLGGFEKSYPKYPKDELLMAARILQENKHAIYHGSPDFYQAALEPTDAGREAYLDGYYTSLALKDAWKVIGVIGGILLSLISAVKWGWPLLQRLLQTG